MIPSSLMVKSDPKLLRRVVQNFLTNAFRYSPNGKVALGVRRVQGRVRIDVWDNGMGIEEENSRKFSKSLIAERKCAPIKVWD